MAISCVSGNSRNNNDSKNGSSGIESTTVMLERVSHVMADTAATPKAVSDAVLPLANRLLELAKGEDKDMRVSAQGLSQELLMDIVFKFDSPTQEEQGLLNECLSALGRVAEQWAVIKGPDGTITLTKEIFYVSYQSTKNSKEGIFTIQVTPPTSSEQEAYVKVTFPSTAAYSPVMVFSKFKSSEAMEEDRDSWRQVEFDQWWAKGQFGNEIPLMASGRGNILEKMLEYDILYISFISENLSEQCPGGYEAARISLKAFKEEYVKHERDNYRYL